MNSQENKIYDAKTAGTVIGATVGGILGTLVSLCSGGVLMSIPFAIGWVSGGCIGYDLGDVMCMEE